jgi:hypothetical protein
MLTKIKNSCTYIQQLLMHILENISIIIQKHHVERTLHAMFEEEQAEVN